LFFFFFWFSFFFCHCFSFVFMGGKEGREQEEGTLGRRS